MEPRLFRHGNPGDCTVIPPLITIWLQWSHVFSDMEMEPIDWLARREMGGFNGATSFQTWKSTPTFDISGVVPGSFNGATSFQTWKFGLVPYIQDTTLAASMEPRLFRHGNKMALIMVQWTFPCFNGATSFQTWKLSSRTGFVVKYRGASMEPRLFRHGNLLSLNRPESLASFSCFNGATSFQTWK